MRQLWQDTFDGPAGALPSPAIWTPQYGRLSGEQQFYTNRPGNVSLDGSGHLQITARAEPPPDGSTPAFTSAKVITKGLQEVALPESGVRVEASIQAPATPGLLPAFWLLGDPSAPIFWPAAGEIDIAEWPAQMPGVYSCHLHTDKLGGPGSDSNDNAGSPAVGPGFHVYGVDWHQDRIDWLLDGAVVCSRTRDEHQAMGGDWSAFDGGWPFYVILNIAVGNAWTGPPTSSSVFPQTMLVDYVRVSEL